MSGAHFDSVTCSVARLGGNGHFAKVGKKCAMPLYGGACRASIVSAPFGPNLQFKSNRPLNDAIASADRTLGVGERRAPSTESA